MYLAWLSVAVVETFAYSPITSIHVSHTNEAEMTVSTFTSTEYAKKQHIHAYPI